MPIFNNVEAYFSIQKYKWRIIKQFTLGIKDQILCMASINQKKKLNQKKHWIEKMVENFDCN